MNWYEDPNLFSYCKIFDELFSVATFPVEKCLCCFFCIKQFTDWTDCQYAARESLLLHVYLFIIITILSPHVLKLS